MHGPVLLLRGQVWPVRHTVPHPGHEVHRAAAEHPCQRNKNQDRQLPVRCLFPARGPKGKLSVLPQKDGSQVAVPGQDAKQLGIRSGPAEPVRIEPEGGRKLRNRTAATFPAKIGNRRPGTGGPSRCKCGAGKLPRGKLRRQRVPHHPPEVAGQDEEDHLQDTRD
uniref:(northern house mosquito) hypothetical protein n=1 Tax=Culex pipiens TaxID=7175 RepID=A0A8D8D3S3_CULPI